MFKRVIIYYNLYDIRYVKMIYSIFIGYAMM